MEIAHNVRVRGAIFSYCLNIILINVSITCGNRRDTTKQAIGLFAIFTLNNIRKKHTLHAFNIIRTSLII